MTARALFLGSISGKGGLHVITTDGTSSGTKEIAIPNALPFLDSLNSIDNFIRLPSNRLLFIEDQSNESTIITSDGTQQGTASFVLQQSLLGASAATIGNYVLLSGVITSKTGVPSTIQFVLTNGTAAGTSTFTVAGPPLPYSVNLGGFVSAGSKVFFSGTDYNGKAALWVSDGTAAGTMPLQVTGIASTGLSPTQITALGDKVLFSGVDSNGYTGLWVSDGTAGGTSELVGTTRFSTGDISSFLPFRITVVGQEAYFSIIDNGSGLWVSDGTQVGTREISIPGEVSGAFPKNVSPGDFTPIGGNVLFDGDGVLNPNDTSLFVTGGTSATTYEIQWTGSGPHNFTPLNNKVYFAAFDSAGNAGLWVTDGTSSGTFEIQVPNAYSQGVFGGIDFSGRYSGIIGNPDLNMTNVGGTLVFEGRNSLGQFGLWVSDGTSAGTRELVNQSTIGVGIGNITGSASNIDLTSVFALGSTITVAPGPQTVIGAIGDTIIGGSGSEVINATAGAISVSGGSGSMTVFGGVGDTIVGGSGAAVIDGTVGNVTIAVGSKGQTDVIVGSTAAANGAGVDTFAGGDATVLIQGLGKGDIVNFAGQTGDAFINATAGNIPVTLGSGFAAVYGGNGDTITMATGNQLATDFEGGALIMVGSAGTDSVVGSVARGSGIGATTVIGGAANVIVQGLGSGDIVNFAKQTGTAAINALSGNDSITLGTGAATVFAGAGSTVDFGTGNQYAQGLAGGVTFNVGGAGGSDTIIGSGFPVAGAGVDTLVGGAASVLIQGLGKGDIVNFSKQSGSAAINATAGNNAITLGSGAATVFAGAGDTITAGTGNQYIETLAAPGALVKVGAAGTTSVVGSAAGGVPVTVKGGAGSLIYTPGSGNTFVDLTGSTGTAVINGLGPDVSAINDTIIAGNGGATVFGGSGNRIGVGSNASGTDQFFHSTTIAGASIGFGTNGNAGSSAHVTVTGFAETGGNATDFLFYQGETGGTNTSIVTASTQVTVGGTASTQITLPDGTVMVLVGVAKADFNAGFLK